MSPNILIFMTDQEQADVVHPDHPCITPNAYEIGAGRGSLSPFILSNGALLPLTRDFHDRRVSQSARHLQQRQQSDCYPPRALRRCRDGSVRRCDHRAITSHTLGNGMSPMPRTHLTAAGKICTLRRAKAVTCTARLHSGRSKPNNPNQLNASVGKFSVPAGDTISYTNPTRPTRRKAMKITETIGLCSLGWMRCSD